MLIALLVTIYVLIACVVGCAIYVYYKDDEDSDVTSVLAGTWWPITIVIILLYKLFTFICSNICKVFEYLKNEGFHYCKEDIKPCCGQCKYIHELSIKNSKFRCKATYNECSKDDPICQNFKKDKFWRFKYRK